MAKILIIEDDPIVRKLWDVNVRKHFVGAEVVSYPGIDQFAMDAKSMADIGNTYDLIISDVFLAGDRTGIDFVKNFPRNVQEKTILSSSIREEDFYAFSVKHNLNCHFVQKPISKSVIEEELNKIFANKKNPDLNFMSFSPDLKNNRPAKTLAQVNPVIFVTGCNSKVGENICKQLVEVSHYRIVMTALPKFVDDIKKTYATNPRVLVLPLDVADNNQIKDTVMTVLQKWNRIDILINNAGICYRAVTEHMDYDTELKQFQTNYLGPMVLVRTVIPSMRENGRGKIINISSSSAVMGMPTMGSFTSSKYAIEGASQALWTELKPLGINVTVVRSEFANTDSVNEVSTSNKAHISETLIGPYSDYYKYIRPFLKGFMNFNSENPRLVAEKILDVIQTQNPPLYVHDTWGAAFFTAVRNLLPWKWYQGLMNFMHPSKVKLGQSDSRAQKRRLAA